MSDIDLRNGVRITITAPAPRFTVSAPSSAVAVLPVRGPAGADGTGGTGGGVTDHGALTGLADDDHPQYHTNARGDVRYYTKTQVDTSLAGKSATTHTHTAGDVGAEPAGTVAAHSTDTTAVHGITDTAALVVTTDPRLSDARTPTAHTHPTTEVTGLGTAATKNTPATGNAAATEIVLGSDSRLSDARTPTAHLHDDRYYTETEVDTALAGKAATSHNHVAADVTDLGTAATKNTPATGDALAGQVVLGSDTRLSDARTPTAHTHPATGVTFTPTGNLAATDVQGALAELDTEKETPAGAQAKVDTHAGATDPHGDRAYADSAIASAAVNAKVASSVALSIPHATATYATFNAELADTDGMSDLATAPDRITVTRAGLYLLVAAVDWQASNVGLRFVNIFKVGAPVATDRRNAAHESEVSIAALVPAVAGDYFRLQVYQDSGAALNTNANNVTLAAVRVSA